MKRFLTVVSALILIIAVLITGMLTWRDFRDAAGLAKIEKEVEAKDQEIGGAAKDLYKGLLKGAGVDVSASQFTIAGLVTGLATLLALAALVLIFTAQYSKSNIIGLALIILSIIMIFVNPGYDTGLTGGADSRTIAMVAGAFAIVGALGSLAVTKMRQKG
jgi:hypothetical protein